jgi:glutathione S-transferase
MSIPLNNGVNLQPTLFTFRRCPYAIRARLALSISHIEIKIHEVDLRNKPQAMLECSPKGTVPVLKLQDGSVIEQSLDIMYWSLKKNDPGQWLETEFTLRQQTKKLIWQNDVTFSEYLRRYKYANFFPEQPSNFYRSQCENILEKLDARIAFQGFLCSKKASLADIAIFPFIRQFMKVDEDWFYTSKYKGLSDWLDYFIGSSLFHHVMQK